MRAVVRVREAKKAMEKKQLEDNSLKLAAQDKKWRERDEKVEKKIISKVFLLCNVI
jgi:hypothetical protein